MIRFENLVEKVRSANAEADTELPVGGNYQYRVRGEHHLLNPLTISKVQHAVRSNNFQTFEEYSKLINDQNKQLCTLRGLMEFQFPEKGAPIEEVEPGQIVSAIGRLDRDAFRRLPGRSIGRGGYLAGLLKLDTGEVRDSRHSFVPFNCVSRAMRSVTMSSMARASLRFTLHLGYPGHHPAQSISLSSGKSRA